VPYLCSNSLAVETTGDNFTSLFSFYDENAMVEAVAPEAKCEQN
jgi:hypothetical protein